MPTASKPSARRSTAGPKGTGAAKRASAGRSQSKAATRAKAVSRAKAASRAKASSSKTAGAKKSARATAARTRAASQTESAVHTAWAKSNRSSGVVFGDYAERVVLIPVGAALIARERVLSSVNDTINNYSSTTRAQAQLRRFERREGITEGITKNGSELADRVQERILSLV